MTRSSRTVTLLALFSLAAHALLPEHRRHPTSCALRTKPRFHTSVVLRSSSSSSSPPSSSSDRLSQQLEDEVVDFALALGRAGAADHLAGSFDEGTAEWQTHPKDGRAFPALVTPNIALDPSQMTAWVAANRETVLQMALAHGAVLLRGFPVLSAEVFGETCEALGLDKAGMAGSAAPRTNVFKDTVFTSNESPPSEPIPFHHEMAQTANPPHYLLFWCEVPAAEGGETPIILSQEVAEFVAAAHPDFAQRLRSEGVRYIRFMPEDTDPTSALGRSWKSTFGVETRDAAEHVMRESGYSWEWLPNGDLKTVTASSNALQQDPRTSREVFFNSVVAAYTGWVDSRNDPTKAVTWSDGSLLDDVVMRDVEAFMMQRRVAFPWQAGDILLIDNRVAMHSRNTFTRPRRLLASLWGGRSGRAEASPRVSFLDGDYDGRRKPGLVADVAYQTLRSGDRMPAVGLGMWKVPKDVTADTVLEAIKLGWRHFDCACDYGNEKEVGEGLRKAFDQGLVTRDEIWVTSKLWNTFHAREHVEQALDRTLQDLQLDYVDLYLVHFPIALKFVPFEERYPPEWIFDPAAPEPRMEYARVPMHETWGAMEGLADKGKARNLGLCNVNTGLLRDVLSYARITPAVLQVERHVYLQQANLKRMCDDEGIRLTGFSPLGSGSYVELQMATEADTPLDEPLIVALAAKHGKTPAQVLLRWGIQRGCAAIPKSTKPHRLRENLAIFDFELSEDDMSAIARLDKHRRFNDPGDFTTGMNSFCPIYD